MLQICCTMPAPDYDELTREAKQQFGLLVNRLRRQGNDLATAQRVAYSTVLNESIPYTPQHMEE